MTQENPKILHRIYFTNFAPFYDPFDHYIESWQRELPDYRIMKWDMSNLDVHANAWTSAAFKNKSPVFLAEYFRWKLLYEYGGVYLDADCEVINGKIFRRIVDELYSQDEYEVFFGVEERQNGYPTAQTCGAKPGAKLPLYMKELYENSLPELWHWREKRGLIGPQLMGLYFLNQGINETDDGFFRNLDEPVVVGGAKVYPQTYFSPKFSLIGEKLDYDPERTCIYHMFANSNIDPKKKSKKEREAREQALTFDEYQADLKRKLQFPRYYDASYFQSHAGALVGDHIRSDASTGTIMFGPYLTLSGGEYKAVVDFEQRPEQGRLTFQVTIDHGARLLGQRTFDFPAHGPVECSFTIDQDAGNKLEFVLEAQDIDAVEVRGVKLEQVTRGKLRILHRVYFGFDGKPDIFLRYLETWRQQLPDFKIMMWNASNLPMEINDYVKKLHKEKDHAFLTDFFRWYLLDKYGGVYLDADVEIVNGELLRQIVDELEDSSNADAFIGIDERGGGWYTAHSMASKPGSDIARFMCELYENFGSFAAWRKKGFYFWAPQMTALYFANRGHNVAGMGTTPNLQTPVIVSGVKIYPQDWFSPLAPTGDPKKPFLLNGFSENTCICHHFACSWHDEDSIYLEHSKKRGGQASTLLADLVEGEKRRVFAAGSPELFTLVGRKEADTIRTTRQAGILMYGPYISLEPGRYDVKFRLTGAKSAADTRFEVTALSGDRLLAQVTLNGANPPELIVPLAIETLQEQVEFRVLVDDQADLGISEVELFRLG